MTRATPISSTSVVTSQNLDDPRIKLPMFPHPRVDDKHCVGNDQLDRDQPEQPVGIFLLELDVLEVIDPDQRFVVVGVESFHWDRVLEVLLRDARFGELAGLLLLYCGWLNGRAAVGRQLMLVHGLGKTQVVKPVSHGLR